MTDRADRKGHDRDTAGTFVAEGEQDAENRANNCPPQADDVNDFGNAEKAGFDIHGQSKDSATRSDLWPRPRLRWRLAPYALTVRVARGLGYYLDRVAD